MYSYNIAVGQLWNEGIHWFLYFLLICQVVVEGKDAEGLPFAFLKSVQFKVGGQVVGKVNFSGGKSLQCLLPEKTKTVLVTLEFHSHYGEPPLDIPVDISTASGEWMFNYMTDCTFSTRIHDGSLI